MLEPTRLNLSEVLQKSLKAAQKKNFIHRVIYIANYSPNAETAMYDETSFIILIESDIKFINEECCEDQITGFGLFYTGYFINIIEGPEESITRHFVTLLETFDKGFSNTPEMLRMKILLMSFHINKRFYSTWNGRRATPPVLLDKIEQTKSIEVIARHIHHCILKLYRLSEYLNGQPANLLSTVMDNVSELCRSNLPEVNLLDFLLDSPALMDVKDYLDISRAVPEFEVYHQNIWPLSTDFVPHNTLEEGPQKLVMTVEVKEEKAAVKEKGEKEEEKEGEKEEKEGDKEEDKEGDKEDDKENELSDEDEQPTE